MKTLIQHLLTLGSAALPPLKRDASCGGYPPRGTLNVKQAAARAAFTILLLSLGSLGLAADLAPIQADRAAIERVYYNHRLGDKPPFEQVLSPATLETLVRQDLRKEAALNQAYSVEVTPAM